VQPLLAEHCYGCHGPDAHERRADLRLDQPEDGLDVEREPRLIVPGDLAASELWRRVSADSDERMPPHSAGPGLDAEELQVIRRWIEAGAEWSGHWAFTPPSRPQVPTDGSSWASNELDRFIARRLAAAGLAPSPRADRATLIRRLSLDLHGLPPSVEELDAFLRDDGGDAHERLVERLLSSERFGERMATHWLDLARYADTNGYSIDGGRHMWAWRDWVIQSFNANKPFDEFTIEQLAGDLLPEATRRTRLASGFNRNHMITHEGGTIEEEYRVAYVVDRVKTTAQTWMGLTIGCAQCHDHKYDPVSQREFFELFAFFNTITDKGNDGNGGVNSVPFMAVPSHAQELELERLDGQLRSARRELQRAVRPAQQRRWEQAELARARAGSAPVLEPWFQSGPFTESSGDVAFDTVHPPQPEFEGEQSPGDLVQWTERGDYVDGEIHELPLQNTATFLRRTIRSDVAGSMRVSLGSDDAVKLWWNGELLLSERVQRGVQQGQEKLTLQLMPGANELLLEIVNYGGPGGFTFEVTRFGPPPALVRVLTKAPAERSRPEARQLAAFYREEAPELEPLRRVVREVEREIERIESVAPTTVMVMQEMSRPRDTFVLARGQYDQAREQVSPGVPDCLPPLPEDAPRNRLGLARWLVDPGHPLTARVAVNSTWQMLFGVGLVESSEDFGVRGARPTHPELLDWLAVEFVESGWDVKALIRLIVSSSTYRQSSDAEPAAHERDPRNALLARGPRFRLHAEFIRDQALYVGGLLVEDTGGPSVKPYQPPGLWREMSHFGSTPATEQVYEVGKGEDLWRRSLYTVLKRTVPPPTLAAFDQPNREVCTSRRASTNTPLQALVTMNEPGFVEAARGLAARLLQQDGADAARLTRGFRMLTSRTPTPRELEILEQALARERADFLMAPDRAAALLSIGESPHADLDPAEHAAWTMIASTLLNLSEALTRG